MSEIIKKDQQGMRPFESVEWFDTAQRMAKMLTSSTLVPKSYQGPENTGNAVIALEMANRINMPVLLVMQNLYVVHGNPSWSSKFLVACVNACGKFSPIRYEFKGVENTDSWSCRAKAVDSKGEELCGSWVSIGMAKKEGWFGKSGSKWQTMPELMLQYRAAAFFQRVYAPEISMGISTAEEMEDIRVEDAEYMEVEPTVIELPTEDCPL